jgi:hypothetical protein
LFLRLFLLCSLHAELALLANACTIYEEENRDWEEGYCQEAEKGHGLRYFVSSVGVKASKILMLTQLTPSRLNM